MEMVLLIKIRSISGCTDELACNYNENVSDDDGSCEYAEEYYDCNGDPINDSDGDGIADEEEVGGCTDYDSCNYDPTATDDDGSCYCNFLYGIMMKMGMD